MRPRLAITVGARRRQFAFVLDVLHIAAFAGLFDAEEHGPSRESTTEFDSQPRIKPTKYANVTLHFEKTPTALNNIKGLQPPRRVYCSSRAWRRVAPWRGGRPRSAPAPWPWCRTDLRPRDLDLGLDVGLDLGLGVGLYLRSFGLDLGHGVELRLGAEVGLDLRPHLGLGVGLNLRPLGLDLGPYSNRRYRQTRPPGRSPPPRGFYGRATPFLRNPRGGAFSS